MVSVCAGSQKGWFDSSYELKIAPIVEWLAHISDKDEIKVQFLVGVQNGK